MINWTNNCGGNQGSGSSSSEELCIERDKRSVFLNKLMPEDHITRDNMLTVTRAHPRTMDDIDSMDNSEVPSKFNLDKNVGERYIRKMPAVALALALVNARMTDDDILTDSILPLDTNTQRVMDKLDVNGQTAQTKTQQHSRSKFAHHLRSTNS